ncbi:MAG TPA: D-2-hydroxyacid dehydrogenase [Clostridiaceae bacterium]|nr:D-2-hydroxyacid dehydrogenase [Clostridiaceae bacterium]
MKNILIDVKVDKQRLEELKKIPGVNVEVIDFKEERRYISPDILSGKHILFCTYPPENFNDLDSLELIQINSAGYTQLFNLGLVERGIRACNAQGVFDVPIAEWSIAMMVNLARDLRGMIRNQEARVWDRSARFQNEIRGSIVGIWGYGAIGREIARLAKAFGLKVYSMDRDIPSKTAKANVYRVGGTGDPEGILPDKIFISGQEEEFLKELDFLVITMPLTNNTKGLVGEKELKMLPKTAYVLNPARGPIIQEEALLKALREGWIAGAALDTHYYYPIPADHPLWSFPNVIMTPHISGSSLSNHFVERTWDIFIQNVKRFLSGEPLLNELTTRQLSGE